MAQLSLYVDDVSLERLRSRAQASGCSLSKYVGGLLAEDAASSGYPEGFFKLYGSLRDLDLACPADEIPAPLEPVM
ncbi:MAG: antitoxin [Eggerthellaceae bacterium]|nr:antitoxin [Eggerthellaceae bacterium]